MIKQLGVFFALSIVATAGLAQTYPTKPIRTVVNFAAGGNVDLLARLVTKQMEDDQGWRFIIDNRGGANGLIGVQAAVRSPADGYTLLFAPSGVVYNQILLSKPGYDVRTDFEPITNMCQNSGYVLAVNPQLPARSVKELVALAKSSKKLLSYSTPGAGNASQFVAEIFAKRAGISIFHVPYSNTAPQLLAVMSGDVELTFIPVLAALPNIRSGKVRAVAFTGSTRTESLPDVLTVAESGVPGFLWKGGWFGWFAPAKTPKEIVAKLNSGIASSTRAPRVSKVLAAGECDVVANQPADFGKFLGEELARLAEIAKVANIKVE